MSLQLVRGHYPSQEDCLLDDVLGKPLYMNVVDMCTSGISSSVLPGEASDILSPCLLL